jgi:enoyl-CoA hydratase/carnithine racemase
MMQRGKSRELARETIMIEVERDGRVTRVTLADPDRLNALSDGMLAALDGCLAELATDRSVKVVVLAAKGKAFCAGHDLREMQAARAAPDGGATAFRDLFDRCARVMLALRALPQPVIAEVQGAAVAAGCQLVASCDLAVAADNARFGVNGVNIGLFCSTPMVALTRAIQQKAAFEMLTTGRIIAADEALRIGLVNRVAPAGELRTSTTELAEQIALKLGKAVRIGKEAFYRQGEMGIVDAYSFAGSAMVDNMLDLQTAEGIGAFLDRRTPDWPPEA